MQTLLKDFMPQIDNKPEQQRNKSKFFLSSMSTFPVYAHPILNQISCSEMPWPPSSYRSGPSQQRCSTGRCWKDRSPASSPQPWTRPGGTSLPTSTSLTRTSRGSWGSSSYQRTFPPSTPSPTSTVPSKNHHHKKLYLH